MKNPFLASLTLKKLNFSYTNFSKIPQNQFGPPFTKVVCCNSAKGPVGPELVDVTTQLHYVSQEITNQNVFKLMAESKELVKRTSNFPESGNKGNKLRALASY